MFGTHGSVAHWVADKNSRGLWSGPGRVYPAGRSRVVIEAPQPMRLTARGDVDPSFGTGGVLQVSWGGPQRLPGGGWMFTANDGLPRITDADGHLLASSPAFGATLAALNGGPWTTSTVVGLGNGDVLDVVQHGVITSATFTATTVGRDGTVKRRDVTIGHDEVLATLSPYQHFASGTGAIVATVGGVVRLRADGSLDPRWGLRLAALKGDDQVLAIAPWGNGGVAMVSENDKDQIVLREIGRAGHVVHRRTLATHAFDEDITWPKYQYALATDSHGRVLLGRARLDHSAILVNRYAGVHLDRSFGRRGVVVLKAHQHVQAQSMTVLPDGRIVVLGQLQKFGTVPVDRQDFDSPGWESHGTVIWRLKAK